MAAAFNGSASEERIIKIDYWRQVGVKQGGVTDRPVIPFDSPECQNVDPRLMFRGIFQTAHNS